MNTNIFFEKNPNSGNCYNFSHEFLSEIPKPHPGYLSTGSKLKDNEYTCDTIYSKILDDFKNDIYLENESKKCNPGFNEIRLLIDDNLPLRDFHFIKNENNKWYSKSGVNKIQVINSPNQFNTKVNEYINYNIICPLKICKKGKNL